jgi:hypothetical protein
MVVPFFLFFFFFFFFYPTFLACATNQQGGSEGERMAQTRYMYVRTCSSFSIHVIDNFHTDARVDTLVLDSSAAAASSSCVSCMWLLGHRLESRVHRPYFIIHRPSSIFHIPHIRSSCTWIWLRHFRSWKCKKML